MSELSKSDSASGAITPPPSGAGVSLPQEAVWAQLVRIESSGAFARTERLRRFLRYTVDKASRGQADQIKEYLVGVEVCDRDAAFDPRLDSIVRVEATRLRAKLKEYYASEGAQDSILITFPRGGYVPQIGKRESSQTTPVDLPALPAAGATPRFGGVGKLAVAAAFLLAAVAAVSTWRLTRSPAQADGAVLVRLTSDSGLTGYPSLSPDGKLLVYSSDRGGEGNLSLWVQPVAGGEAVRITSHAADDREPVFSPNGSRIAFRSEREGGGIYVIPIFGGQAKLVARDGRGPRYSPDGKWIAYWVRDETWRPGKMYVVAAAGGTPRQIRGDFDDAHNPVWTPDGHLLFCGTGGDLERPQESGHDWWVTPLEPGPAVKTGIAEVLRQRGLLRDLPPVPAGWAGENRVVFTARLGDSENLWEVPLSPRTWKVTGLVRRLTSGASLEMQASVSGDRVVFASGQRNIDVWSLAAVSNRGLRKGELERLTEDAVAMDSHPSISTDGSKLAFISDRSGNRDVWFMDLVTRRVTALTVTPAAEGYPKVSPDGAQVVYRVIEDPEQALYLVPAAGGAAVKICDDCGYPTSWSSDAASILYEPGSVITDVMELVLATRKSRPLLIHPRLALRSARFSPDDRWIAFHAETGAISRQVFIAPTPKDVATAPEKDWIAVTDATGVNHNPAWSPDGNLLYFLSERDGFRCIWAQPLDRVSRKPAGEALAVAHFHTARRSLFTNVRANPNQTGLTVNHRKMVFSLDEMTSNIWLTRLNAQR